MDEISSGSLSPDTTDRASPLESGIGTASPPRSTDRRLVKRKIKIFYHFLIKILKIGYHIFKQMTEKARRIESAVVKAQRLLTLINYYKN